MRCGVPGGLVGDVVLSSEKAPTISSLPAAVLAEDLTKRFRSTTGMDQLDLEVRPGEVFGFLRPEPCEESTTVQLLLGLLRATATGR